MSETYFGVALFTIAAVYGWLIIGFSHELRRYVLLTQSHSRALAKYHEATQVHDINIRQLQSFRRRVSTYYYKKNRLREQTQPYASYNSSKITQQASRNYSGIYCGN